MRVEIEARSDLNPDIPERAVIETMELLVRSELTQAPHDAHTALEDKYTKLLASKNELEEWFDKEWRWPWEWKMPLIP